MIQNGYDEIVSILKEAGVRKDHGYQNALKNLSKQSNRTKLIKKLYDMNFIDKKRTEKATTSRIVSLNSYRFSAQPTNFSRLYDFTIAPSTPTSGFVEKARRRRTRRERNVKFAQELV